jgi:hypothetical protein
MSEWKMTKIPDPVDSPDLAPFDFWFFWFFGYATEQMKD